ncbi:hypothetical protein SAY87_007350 [Trapa incisa]|uniref:Purple acid phosphatase n=1 Tax=Trapa incisa TaxID=236973 RepID=A0AAN7K477_9MYRT|nr:hypothetical protein SAY87_007350 [Trapa incisa]
MADSSFICPLLLAFLLSIAGLTHGGKTSSFVRKQRKSVCMPINSDVFQEPPGFNSPQQVHITQGNYDGNAVIVSWVTPKYPRSTRVHYWSEKNPSQKKHSHGISTSYKYYNYTSGFIHHCTLKNLAFDTKYYYVLGVGHFRRTFSFTTPPKVGPDVPHTFGVMGDIGQTFDSNTTLTHYMANPKNPQTLLFVGDLSYADDHPFHDNVRWDTWGRFAEKSAAYQAWICAPGNHEIDYAPEIGETTAFKPFLHRYYSPYKDSQSPSPLWYSVRRASAHIIVLSSYSAFAKYSPQHDWLKGELPKVNRTETPWLIVLVHSPLYNSYNYHYMEGEPMRVAFEPWFVEHKVDVVFSGHVHAYERSERISNIDYNITDGLSFPKRNPDAPVYITMGDGGNIEGLAYSMTQPQPAYSAYREASFGHGIFDIKNRTHAYFSWHRNDDGYAVEADSMWFYNRIYYPVDENTDG